MPASSPALSPTDALAANDIDRLRVVLLRLARRIRHSSAGDITPSQRIVLASIIFRERLTIGQIAELEHIKPPSASKIVAALEQRGFVGRETDPTDRRCSYAVATDEGTAFLDAARAAGRTWLADQINELAPDELARIEAALPVLETLLEGTE